MNVKNLKSQSVCLIARGKEKFSSDSIYYERTYRNFCGFKEMRAKQKAFMGVNYHKKVPKVFYKLFAL